MFNLKNVKIISCILLTTISLSGCSKTINNTELENQKTNQEQVESEQNKDNEEDNSNNFNIYDHVINIEHRGADIELAFRNPKEYKGKKFTFCGTVLKSNTSEDGIQTLKVKLDTADTFINGNLEDGKIVKLLYNIDDFGGERLVEDDRLSVSAEFNDIKNDTEYGDIAEFNVFARTSTMDYLSALALDNYFKSIGVDTKTIGLECEQFTNYEEFEKIVGEDTANSEFGYDTNLVSVFSTNSGVYWLAFYNTSESGDYGLELYSGEKDEKGNIGFTYKEHSYLDLYDI